MQNVRLTLSVLIYQEDSWWIAHCLETDVVAEGNTAVRAFENLISLTNLQIEAAMSEGDLQSVFRPAPPSIQAVYAVAADKSIHRRRPKMVERFDVRMMQPA